MVITLILLEHSQQWGVSSFVKHGLELIIMSLSSSFQKETADDIILFFQELYPYSEKYMPGTLSWLKGRCLSWDKQLDRMSSNHFKNKADFHKISKKKRSPTPFLCSLYLVWLLSSGNLGLGYVIHASTYFLDLLEAWQ